MKRYDKNTVLKIIVNAAKEYEQKLNNKHFMIIYQTKKEIKYVEVGFRGINFLHLTGVSSNLSASMFYSACISGKLSERNFNIDKGKVYQKLQVLPYLSDLLYNNCMIGDFLNNGLNIKADYFVGNTRAVLSVGFRFGKFIDYPITLYNEDVKALAKPVHKVLGIFSKKFSDKKYVNVTYISQGYKINDFSEEIKAKIDIGKFN